MLDKIVLEVVTPEQFLLKEEVDEVSAPGTEGDFGVLPGHCEFLTTLRVGELNFRVGEVSRTLPIYGGFAEVRNNRVIILANSMEQHGITNVEKGVSDEGEEP
jgi:F-type H+-transporting ATPase subunit epsilon